MAPGAEATNVNVNVQSNGTAATATTTTTSSTTSQSDEFVITASEKSQTPFPKPPKFTDKLEERAYLKFRLAQAFRIFGMFVV